VYRWCMVCVRRVPLAILHPMPAYMRTKKGPDMYSAAITGSGVFTPEHSITNDELVVALNAHADLFNAENADAIAAGTIAQKPHSSSDFVFAASGIERRYVLDKEGVLDPARMYPKLPDRSDDDPSLMAEMAVDAALQAMAQAGKSADDIDAAICAASNHERAYPAIAVEIQNLLEIDGFAFDMNVACSSATFGIQMAADMIKSGSISSALVVCPEICSAHLEWRDRDCHFIFGDVATALLIERDEDLLTPHFKIKSTKLATQFSNNIRNNNGFLRRTRDQMDDRRDMQFMQNGRKVFKEVLPMVSKHIADHMDDEGLQATDLKRLWLHQANKTMNDYIGKKVLGRDPTAGEQPNILQDYANTSSAGSIIAFAKYSSDMVKGDVGLICSFGAGYSVGSVILERA
jgi:beta-ketodecanoyl-[acyl-carrier-protein] synthase